ncbi:MAG: PqqD family protein [Actinomycetota bacterium]|jgi:hypothetical protein|nr:PqqD family protein [Actinomycetota bacterium]
MVSPQASSGEGLLRLRADAVDWREVEGEVVVLDRTNSAYLAVNAAGAALWPALARGSNAEELVAILRSEFDVDDARARADVDDFVAMLRKRELLES